MRKLRRAFSLVELVVVIGIIAVLIGILIPVVTKARSQATTVKCMSNERNLMTAMLAFAADNDNQLPFTSWNGAVNKPNWLYMNTTNTQNTIFLASDVETGQLWKYLNNRACFRCPLDTGPWQGSEIMTSYVMNGAASSFSTNGNVGNSILSYRSNGILFWETPLSLGVKGGYTFNDATNYPDEGITARHAHGTTVGHVDGHVEVMNGMEFNAYVQAGIGTTVGADKPPPNRLWCDPKSKDGGRGARTPANPIIIQE